MADYKDAYEGTAFEYGKASSEAVESDAKADARSDWAVGYDRGFAEGYGRAKEEIAIAVLKAVLNG